MPLIIPEGYIEVAALYSSGAGQHQALNKWGYKITVPFTQTDVNQISGALAVPYKALLNSGDTFYGVRVLQGTAGAPAEFSSTTGTGVGGSGGALCPPQVQGLVKKLTGFSGRHFRGRMFLPDMQESHVGDLGTLDSTQQTLVTGVAQAWFAMDASVTSGSVDYPVLFHQDNSTPSQILSYLTETKVATLRRRFPR